METQKFRKRPVEIEAMQLTRENASEIAKWAASTDAPTITVFGGDVKIHTLEGLMHASLGDWIIKGVQGEFYPCKPDIFEQTYDKVGDGERTMVITEQQIGFVLDKDMTIGDLFAQVLAEKEANN